jgi:hypothetical protein
LHASFGPAQGIFKLIIIELFVNPFNKFHKVGEYIFSTPYFHIEICAPIKWIKHFCVEICISIINTNKVKKEVRQQVNLWEKRVEFINNSNVK